MSQDDSLKSIQEKNNEILVELLSDVPQYLSLVSSVSSSPNGIDLFTLAVHTNADNKSFSKYITFLCKENIIRYIAEDGQNMVTITEYGQEILDKARQRGLEALKNK